ncbi:hypothetical protein B0H17DRAFT_1138489 [Mycena rosella]|uniref:Uncharacterized protein n=1 Tax=Mycena rosella TaxID=1033263 RepID=A0AAD7GEC0_MYCRO|nr:hypothetical protein B0H17DRAFT_1138489 [Mycena rosella]
MRAVLSRGKYATSQKPPRKMSGTRKYGPLGTGMADSADKDGIPFPTDYPDSVLIAIAIPHESPAEIGRLLCGFRIRRDTLVQNMEQTIQLRATFTMEKGNCLVGYDTNHRYTEYPEMEDKLQIPATIKKNSLLEKLKSDIAQARASTLQELIADLVTMISFERYTDPSADNIQIHQKEPGWFQLGDIVEMGFALVAFRQASRNEDDKQICKLLLRTLMLLEMICSQRRRDLYEPTQHQDKTQWWNESKEDCLRVSIKNIFGDTEFSRLFGVEESRHVGKQPAYNNLIEHPGPNNSTMYDDVIKHPWPNRVPDSGVTTSMTESPGVECLYSNERAVNGKRENTGPVRYRLHLPIIRAPSRELPDTRTGSNSRAASLGTLGGDRQSTPNKCLPRMWTAEAAGGPDCEVTSIPFTLPVTTLGNSMLDLLDPWKHSLGRRVQKHLRCFWILLTDQAESEKMTPPQITTDCHKALTTMEGA